MFDFLKGNKKRRKKGGREAQSWERRPDQHTILVPRPQPPGGSNANPFDGQAPNVLPPRVQPRHPMPPSAPRPTGAPSPPPPAEQVLEPSGDQTQYVRTDSPDSGVIVGVLVAIEGDLRGQTFAVLDGENEIGRGRSCPIRLDHKRVSRSHAMLIHEEGMFFIKPLTEKQPTFLNEAPTVGDEVGDGDILRLGTTTLKFRSI